ncbi:hypothetical protein SAP269_22360 (plasmid) [Spiroplasma ixodetis]|uniref:Uncharacterized protein n=2 Tax=Spiroplasma ixodetis TaxID=2141 RepID=A0ABM8JQN7_9MOLU
MFTKSKYNINNVVYFDKFLIIMYTKCIHFKKGDTMAKKINNDFLDNITFDENISNSLKINKESKDETKIFEKFLSQKLVKEKEKRLTIHLSSYQSIENMLAEMQKQGLKVTRSTIYRNAVMEIYKNWNKEKRR